MSEWPDQATRAYHSADKAHDRCMLLEGEVSTLRARVIRLEAALDALVRGWAR